MTQSFGEWLLDYSGDGPIGDLRDDYARDYRVLLKPQGRDHVESPELLMWRIGLMQGCSEAKQALKDAAVLYGQPLKGWDD